MSMIRTITEGDEALLQTAVTTLDRSRSKRLVTLVACIHIGLPSYFDELNQLIAAHKGAVLYEGIGALTPEEIDSLSPEEKAIFERLSPLHELYEKLATPLGLVFQGTALHYDREHWINADIPLRRLIANWKDVKAPPLPIDKLPTDLLESEASRRFAVQLLLQEPLILQAFNGVRSWLPPLRRMSDVLIEQRNQAAIDAFDRVDPDEDVLIIYGAGHMQGLLDALRERWYWRKEESWYTALRGESLFGGGLKSLLGGLAGSRS
jgi:hypothetical protein